MIRIFILFLMLLVVALGVSAESLPELEEILDNSTTFEPLGGSDLEDISDPDTTLDVFDQPFIDELAQLDDLLEDEKLDDSSLTLESDPVLNETEENDTLNSDLAFTEDVKKEEIIDSNPEPRVIVLPKITEEEVVDLIDDELKQRPNRITEEEVRAMVKEEIKATEQFSSGSSSILWTAILLLVVGGAVLGYIVWNRKKATISSSLPKINIAHKPVVPVQLAQYISTNAHFGKVSLRKSLISSGWNPEQVRQALIEAGL